MEQTDASVCPARVQGHRPGGIAAAKSPVWRYVFDVADTGGGDNARRPYLWRLQDEHMNTVLRALEARYEVSGADGLEYQLELVADRLVKDYWADHQRDILGIIEDSFLEEYDVTTYGRRSETPPPPASPTR